MWYRVEERPDVAVDHPVVLRAPAAPRGMVGGELAATARSEGDVAVFAVWMGAFYVDVQGEEFDEVPARVCGLDDVVNESVGGQGDGVGDGVVESSMSARRRW